MQFMDDKEAHFRQLAMGILEPTGGLLRFCKWVEEKGLTRAAVTNAPRANAEQMIKAVGLEQFFQLCEQATNANPFRRSVRAYIRTEFRDKIPDGFHARAGRRFIMTSECGL